jgi:hypothetical protein
MLELELEASRQEASGLRERVTRLTAAAQAQLDGVPSPLALQHPVAAAAALPGPGARSPDGSSGSSGGRGAVAGAGSGPCCIAITAAGAAVEAYHVPCPPAASAALPPRSPSCMHELSSLGK